jgi:DNA-binding NarL/FixJ family response regulator
MKIRILLADDHPMIRAGFKSMLDKNERFEIVGEAENGKELTALASQLNPDIILVDISMPVMNGLDALEALSSQLPGVRIIVLTMHEEREYILQALKGGAAGYLLKNIERFELERAIMTVYEGGKYFSPIITNILAEAVAKLLGISIRTVESHRINMLKKMKVNNTAGLIKKAIELKILT